MIDPRIGEILEFGIQLPVKTIGGRRINGIPTQMTGLGDGVHFCVIDDPRPDNWQELLEELRGMLKPQRKAKRESIERESDGDDE